MSQPFKFYTPIKVRFNETDLQGHVNFTHYLAYFDVGLTEYLAAINYDYHTIVASGVDFLYAESHCNYKSPAKWAEVLNVHTRIGHMGQRSIRFDFEVRAVADHRVVATGHIVVVTATRGSFEPCPIPEAFQQAIANYEGTSVLRNG